MAKRVPTEYKQFTERDGSVRTYYKSGTTDNWHWVIMPVGTGPFDAPNSAKAAPPGGEGVFEAPPARDDSEVGGRTDVYLVRAANGSPQLQRAPISVGDPATPNVVQGLIDVSISTDQPGLSGRDFQAALQGYLGPQPEGVSVELQDISRNAASDVFLTDGGSGPYLVRAASGDAKSMRVVRLSTQLQVRAYAGMTLQDFLAALRDVLGPRKAGHELRPLQDTSQPEGTLRNAKQTSDKVGAGL